MSPRILHVSGFHPDTRAKDLAYEFERYGPIVRCDIPAPKTAKASANPYAFVEYRDPIDAADAYERMHGVRIDGAKIGLQWARTAPSMKWRQEETRSSRDERGSGSSRRSDRGREAEDERGYRDRPRDRSRERERERDRGRDRSRSPAPRRRSRSPKRERSPPAPRERTPERATRYSKADPPRNRAHTPPSDYDQSPRR